MLGETTTSGDNALATRVSKKKHAKKEGLPLIECFCGAEILLVPDVKLMSEAIEAHAQEHATKVKGAKNAEAEAERVRDNLIAKVLSRACEI
jgi:hypothetical protein